MAVPIAARQITAPWPKRHGIGVQQVLSRGALLIRLAKTTCTLMLLDKSMGRSWLQVLPRALTEVTRVLCFWANGMQTNLLQC